MKVLKKEKITTGNRIKNLIKEKGITQEQLAELIKNKNGDSISVQSVSAWVTDKSFPKKHITALADFFDVDVEYLKCTQVEKRKKDFSKFDLGTFQESFDESMLEMKTDKLFIDFLSESGIKTEIINNDITSEETDKFETIIDGCLCEIEFPIGIPDVKYIVSVNNKRYEFTEKDFRKYKKHIQNYSLFILDNSDKIIEMEKEET